MFKKDLLFCELLSGGVYKANSQTVFLPAEENYGKMKPVQESNECALNSPAD